MKQIIKIEIKFILFVKKKVSPFPDIPDRWLWDPPVPPESPSLPD